jgi:hypothetical protein
MTHVFMRMKDMDDLMQQLMEIMSNGGVLAIGNAFVIVGGQNDSVPGSKLALCQDCGATIYLSDAAALPQRWPDAPVTCIKCALVRARER